MNAERLHALADKVAEELSETAALDNLESVVSALQAVVNQSTANNQQQLASALEEFRVSLATTSIPRWSPAWRQLLCGIGADEILGQNLLESVNAIISSNAITPAVARKEVEAIHGKVEQLSTAIESLQNAFETLQIEAEELEAGECEVGFLIPRLAVDNELGSFAKELKELEFILRTLSEVATGKVEPVEIRTVSSSDFLILLAQHSGQSGTSGRCPGTAHGRVQNYSAHSETAR